MNKSLKNYRPSRKEGINNNSPPFRRVLTSSVFFVGLNFVWPSVATEPFTPGAKAITIDSDTAPMKIAGELFLNRSSPITVILVAIFKVTLKKNVKLLHYFQIIKYAFCKAA